MPTCVRVCMRACVCNTSDRVRACVRDACVRCDCVHAVQSACVLVYLWVVESGISGVVVVCSGGNAREHLRCVWWGGDFGVGAFGGVCTVAAKNIAAAMETRKLKRVVAGGVNSLIRRRGEQF